MRAITAALLLTLAGPALANDFSAVLPAWLAGAWEHSEGSSWSDEFWTPPRGGIMIGAARIGEGYELSLFEHTRIVRKPDGTLVFVAQPGGKPPSEFPLVAADAAMVEFANPAHDFPQRIRYWRDGRLLKARISLMDGSKAIEWIYQPMGGGE